MPDREVHTIRDLIYFQNETALRRRNKDWDLH